MTRRKTLHIDQFIEILAADVVRGDLSDEAAADMLTKFYGVPDFSSHREIAHAVRKEQRDRRRADEIRALIMESNS